MAKKNRKFNSDQIRQRRDAKKTTKAVNPFEYKITKAKRVTLNTKVQKAQISRPGQSRVRHRQIQDETLMVEYKNKNRKNVFIDNRIDKKTANTDELEKAAVEKFAIAARRKALSKRKFDSGIGEVGDYDDEGDVLTHRGQSLATMERFDDPDLSDGDDDRNPGHLNQEATEALFGGGEGGDLFTKRDHKEIMLDVIAKAKKHKYERQAEKDKMLNEFEQFDEQFKHIRKLTATLERNADQKYDDRRNLGKDDFSRLMREMKFDARVQPGKRLKTNEELAKERHEEQMKKINEMKKRMKAANSDDENDDEGHGDSVEHIPQQKAEVKEAAPLAYDMDSGILLNNHDELSAALRNIRKTDSDGEEIEDDEEESEEEEGDEEESGDEENDGKILNPQPTFDSDDDQDDDRENEEDDDEEDAESDAEPKSKKARVLEIEDEADEGEVAVKKSSNKLVPLLTMVSAKGDALLSSYGAFAKALNSRPDSDEKSQMVIGLCRKITTGTDADRPAKLRALFQFTLLALMQGTLPPHGQLAPTLYTISEKCQATHDTISVLLAEFASDSAQVSIEWCRLMRVIVTLYSMSDYRNPIGLAAQSLAIKMLAKIRARSLDDVALGVYICALLLESVRLSGRFIPEIFVYLQSVLALGLEADERPKSIFPSFKLMRNTLAIDESYEPLDLTTTGHTSSGSDIIHAAVQLTQLAAERKNVAQWAATAEVFGPLGKLIGELPLEGTMKKEVVGSIDKLVGLSRVTISRKKKVKMLQMYEPKIELPGTRQETRKARELKNLKKEVKKEKRGARKNIKLNAERIREEKLKVQMKTDQKRKDVTKSILGQLSAQEGDVKKTQRAKYNLFPDL